MDREELDYQRHCASICVPLKKTDKDFVFLPDAKEDEVIVFQFSNYKLFEKFVYADFMYEIAEKCHVDFLGRYESDTLMPDVLPTAIEIVSQAIKQKKNAAIKEYLEKTKEFMELAISLDTFIQFDL
jgi:hypothetical protein